MESNVRTICRPQSTLRAVDNGTGDAIALAALIVSVITAGFTLYWTRRLEYEKWRRGAALEVMSRFIANSTNLLHQTGSALAKIQFEPAFAPLGNEELRAEARPFRHNIEADLYILQAICGGEVRELASEIFCFSPLDAPRSLGVRSRPPRGRLEEDTELWDHSFEIDLRLLRKAAPRTHHCGAARHKDSTPEIGLSRVGRSTGAAAAGPDRTAQATRPGSTPAIPAIRRSAPPPVPRRSRRASRRRRAWPAAPRPR